MPEDTELIHDLRVQVARLEERVSGDVRLQDERQASSERALEVARKETETARANANEWRGALNDALARFVTREEWELQHRTVVKELADAKDALSCNAGRGAGADNLWLKIMGVAALGLTLGGIIVAAFLKFK